MTKDEAQELFRTKVLEAMDEAAKEVFGDKAPKGKEGSLDEDLPHIFACVDKQFERLSSRIVMAFYTEEELSDMYWNSQGDA